MAGLASAWRLQRAGVTDFVLLELESEAGGTARSGRTERIGYPWGAHYLPAPLASNRALVELLREMEVVEGIDDTGEPIIAEQFLCRDPQERIFYRGRWYEGLYLYAGASDGDLAQLDRFEQEIARWVAWRDGRGRRAFALPVAAGTDDAEVTALDRMSMADWMQQQRFTSPRLQWLVEYACRDDYGLTTSDTSAWAGLFYFASRVRQAGADSQPLITWPEGNGRLVAHLSHPVRDRMRLGTMATAITPAVREGKRGVDVIALDASRNRVIGFRADRVIFAAPQFLRPYLIRNETGTADFVKTFEYGAWMVANLFLRDRPQSLGFPLAWDNVFYESPSLGYVTATHQRGLDYGPTVLTYYYPLCDRDPRQARDRLLSLGREDWGEVALADFSIAHPGIRSLVERLDVMRWGHAMIQPRPGFVWGGARQKAAAPEGEIHFAHSDLSGVALFEEAFYHGVRAAEEILAARGLKTESLLS